MKNLLMSLAFVLLIAVTSCGSDNKEDEIIDAGPVGGSTSGNEIAARYIEPYEVKNASVEEVKQYMSKVAGDLWMKVYMQDAYGNIGLSYTFHDPDNPPKEGKIESYGAILYIFLNGGLSSFSIELPTYQMCFDGLSKNHEFINKISGDELSEQGAYFKTKDGKNTIMVTELKAANTTVGHVFCSFR